MANENEAGWPQQQTQNSTTGGATNTTPLWQDAPNIGNNMVVNSQTGQVVDKNHPVYTSWLSSQQPQQQTEEGGGVQGAGTPPAGQPVDYKQQLKQQLLERMQQPLDVNPNDPIIKAQTTAYNAQQDRVMRQAQDVAAEQAGAHNLGNSGALANEKRLAQENAGFNTANMQAQLLQQELGSRREEISNALTSMAGILSEEEKNALTKEMHDIDAAIERDKTTNQNSQYYAGLSSNERIAANRLAEEWALGQQGNEIDWARLAQGDNQWADQMGFNAADRQAYWDAVRRGQT